MVAGVCLLSPGACIFEVDQKFTSWEEKAVATVSTIVAVTGLRTVIQQTLNPTLNVFRLGVSQVSGTPCTQRRGRAPLLPEVGCFDFLPNSSTQQAESLPLLPCSGMNQGNQGDETLTIASHPVARIRQSGQQG